MKDPSKQAPARHVRLTLDAGLIPLFFRLLQKGFRVEGNVGCSVRAFLCEQLGVPPEYLEERIQTLFLNGRPVDDVESATVGDGAALSLSAALPGLVGAVMRRGGYYAPLRDQISHREKTASAAAQPGRVMMKLFNLPLHDLGPMFLERGILIEGGDLKDVLAAHADDFRKGFRSARVDGRNFDADSLPELDLQTGEIFLQIKSS